MLNHIVGEFRFLKSKRKTVKALKTFTVVEVRGGVEPP